MQPLYVNISEENAAYLTALKDQSGLSKSAAVGMLLDKARELGWRIIPGDAPRVTYLMD